MTMLAPDARREVWVSMQDVPCGPNCKYTRPVPTSAHAVPWFGSPDGATEDLARPSVPLRAVLLGPQTRINTASVIAGRLGAGKTYALRQLWVEARKENSRSTHLADQPPSLSILADIAATSRTSFQTELWADVWDRSFLLSLASHWDPDGSTLADEFRHLDLSPSHRPLSPYNALERLGRARSSHSAVPRVVGHPAWDDMRHKLASISLRMPPFTMLIDSIDNSYSFHPALMMNCQKGLFYAALNWKKNRDLAKRARMVVALRDLVVSAVVQSEQSARLLGAPDVAILDWSPRDLMSMVMLRIADQATDACDFTEAEFLIEFARVLGLGSVDDSADLWSRILNFSSGVPRDVITMLNALARQLDGNDVGLPSLSRALERGAKLVGRSKIGLASTEILVQLTDASGWDRVGRHTWGETDRSDTQIAVEGVGDQLIQLIRFSVDPQYGEIDPGRLSDASDRYFGSDITHILWRHGVIGTVSRSRKNIHFRSASEWDTLTAPSHAGETFGVHPSIGLLAQLGTASTVGYSVDFGQEW